MGAEPMGSCQRGGTVAARSGSCPVCKDSRRMQLRCRRCLLIVVLRDGQRIVALFVPPGFPQGEQIREREPPPEDEMSQPFAAG